MHYPSLSLTTIESHSTTSIFYNAHKGLYFLNGLEHQLQWDFEFNSYIVDNRTTVEPVSTTFAETVLSQPNFESYFYYSTAQTTTPKPLYNLE